MSQSIGIKSSPTGPFVYVENVVGESLAFGSDNSAQMFVLNTSASPNVVPDSTTANINFDPTANGNITFLPNGTGNSIFSSGDVSISLGNLDLPATSAGFTGGTINLNSAPFVHGYGVQNTFVGSNAGNSTLSVGDAQQNNGLGYQALASLTFGDNNDCVGFQSGTSLTTGSENQCFGSYSGANLSTGAGNVLIGYQAGINGDLGNLNVMIGYQTGSSSISTNASNIYILNTGADESNTIRIGTDGSGAGQQNTCYIAGIYGNSLSGSPVVVTSSGQLGVGSGGGGTNISFLSYNSVDIPAVTGDGTFYTIPFDTAVVNNGSGYDNTTGIFTATVAGIYQFNVTVGVNNLTTAHDIGQIQLVTTSRTYFSAYANYGANMAADNIYMQSFSVLANMALGDTAQVITGVFDGGKTVGVYGGDTNSSFSGFLINAPTSTPNSFLAYISSNPTNVTGSGTIYQIPFDTTVFNNGSGLNTVTGVFTAPATGLYQFNITVGADTVFDPTVTIGWMQLVTSQHTYTSNYSDFAACTAVNGVYMMSMSVLAPMTIGDTALVQFAAFNGATDTVGLYGGDINTSFSGYQVA